MESSEFSLLSSLRGEFKSEDYIKPHYKETYRLAIDRLVEAGRDGYHEFLKGERVGGFLSEDELLFITENAERLPPQKDIEEINGPPDNQSSSGTYWPIHSDVDTPNLDLGWPQVMHEQLQTNIDLLYQPPRPNNPTIKEVVRKQIQEARQVVAIVMDKFTDVDIFKETVEASIRGVAVYIILDSYYLKSFLTMAASQDVKLQQLRNMRVRTVKGQNYLCRSGAKFHGAVEQKFLLVDCHTAIYGSYSFTWSYEKINLSMVQVITGHLVKSYDEEFRTLYARSTVPVELCPAESQSAAKLDRKDQLRHTLDTVYRKTCERRLSTLDINERLLEEESNTLGPLMENGLGVEGYKNQYQPAEAMNFLKRHSYAGERQDGCFTPNRPRGSNWNIHREKENEPSNYYMDNYLQVPQMYRSQNIRQSYNGTDKRILSMQQNIPTFEKASKTFMRSLRIESYLNNPDVPFTESCEYLDQFEPQDKSNSYLQGRMRSSLVFRSTMPDQMEPNRHMNNTPAGIGGTVSPNSPMHYSQMQWNQPMGSDSRMNNEDLMKRPSLQMLDEYPNNAGYGTGRNIYQSSYASLGRSKGGNMITNPDMLSDSWQKRHSVADPKSNTEYPHESAGQMYGAYRRTQGNRSTAGLNVQNGGFGSNLMEDQRSVSHYDVKSVTDTKSPNSHIWQEPPSRTLSAAALDINRKALTDKSGNMDSQQFLSKGTKKIKSFLNIPEKKSSSIRGMETLSLKSGESTDTITAEDEVNTTCVGRRSHQSTASVGTSSSERQSSLEEEQFKSSKPRFRTEEQHNPLQTSLSKATSQKKGLRSGLDLGSFSKDRGSESRLYSRFEPFCSLDKKNSSTAHAFGSTRAHDNTKSIFKGDVALQHGFTRGARGHHENKLEKFFHRVGNLIHKNK